MGYKLLLVEDDVVLRNILSLKFNKKGMSVQFAAEGEVVPSMLYDFTPDCILLDIFLPKQSGYDVLKKVKRLYNGPIVMYTSVCTNETEVASLRLGAADIIDKSKSFEVLYTRIKKAIDNSVRFNKAMGSSLLACGNLILNKEESSAYWHDKKIEMTMFEFKVLYYFVINIGRVVTRDEICLAVKGYSYNGKSRSIDVTISRLRVIFDVNKMDSFAIRAIRGKGYLFKSFVNRLSN